WTRWFTAARARLRRRTGSYPIPGTGAGRGPGAARGVTEVRRVDDRAAGPAPFVHPCSMTSTLPGVGDRARSTALPALLAGTEAVLLDFDGPVCDLFGPVPTAHVAAEIKTM